MKRILTMVSVIAFAAGTAQAHSLQDLEGELLEREKYAQFVDQPAPNFTLDAARGGVVSLDDFTGKVVVLNFIYTHCPDVCPLHTALLADLQDQVNRTAMGELVQFISITTDSARDTPAVLKDYAAAQGLDPANWNFLTDGAGNPEKTRAIARDYGLKFTPGDDGYLLHGIVTHVIDRHGIMRARYHGLKVDPLNIILYINALTNDIH